MRKHALTALLVLTLATTALAGNIPYDYQPPPPTCTENCENGITAIQTPEPDPELVEMEPAVLLLKAISLFASF